MVQWRCEGDGRRARGVASGCRSEVSHFLRGFGCETRNAHMQEITGHIRRLLGIDKINEESSRVLPASKRLRDSRDDDPPAMKKYCNVSNTFPKIMPTEDESWRTPASTPRVRFIPVTKEDDPPSARFTHSRLNPIRHSSPLSDDKFTTFPSYRETDSKSPINARNDSACACSLASVDRTNLHARNSRFTEGTLSRHASRFTNTFNDSKFSSRRSIDSNRYLEEENGVEDDDADDDVKCLGFFQLRDGVAESSDVIDLSDDTESYELILKPKASKKHYDSSGRKPDSISNNKFKNFKCQNRNRQPSYIYSLFPRKSTKPMFKSPKCITKARVSLFDSSPRSRIDRIDSQRGSMKNFRLDEKQLFRELIHHTLTNRSQSNYAKRLQDDHRRETEKESSKNDVIDLTVNLYPKKLSNGTSESVNSTRNKKLIDNSCNANLEQSDPELITSADESSTTSSVQLKPKNSLEIFMRHNQILRSNWLDNLNKRYGEISLHKEQEVTKIQEEKEEPELPCLTDEQEIKINRALKPNPPDETLVEKFNSSIRRRDLQTLVGLNWLNDEIINFYVNLIMERSQAKKGLPKVYSTNSFFLQRLMKDGHVSLKRWTRKVDIFSHDLMVIPVHLGVHWCMSIINFKECTIKYYDSMGGDNKACCNALLKYLEDEKMDKKKEKLDSSIWSLECVKDIPQQMNGSDCGMFSCMFAEYISRNVPISFSQNDMPYFRRKMVLEIIEGRLLM